MTGLLHRHETASLLLHRKKKFGWEFSELGQFDKFFTFGAPKRTFYTLPFISGEVSDKRSSNKSIVELEISILNAELSYQKPER